MNAELQKLKIPTIPKKLNAAQIAMVEKAWDGPAKFFVQRGCIACHNISIHDIKGLTTIGPDLSIAVEDVKTRFGRTVEDFLDKPQGTMQMVLGDLIKLPSIAADASGTVYVAWQSSDFSAGARDAWTQRASALQGDCPGQRRVQLTFEQHGTTYAVLSPPEGVTLRSDVLRRGRATVHVKYDEATALLVGDSLQSLAFHLLADARSALPADTRLAMVRILSNAAGSRGMAGGQAIDLASVGQSLDEQTLRDMHHRKTGALLRASVQMGAACGGVQDSSPVWAALTAYGEAMGLAFQVVDDILDATQPSDTLGKTAGKDADANKPTYVSLLGLEQARGKTTPGELREIAVHPGDHPHITAPGAHGRAGAVGTGHQHHVVLGGQAGHHLHDTRVPRAGHAFDAFQQLDLLRAVQRGDRVQRGVEQAALGHLGLVAHLDATALPGGGNGAHRAGGVQQGGLGQVVRVGESGLLASDGAHTHALVDREAAALDDAFLQAPAFVPGVLEVEIRVVHLVLTDGGQGPGQRGLRQLIGVQQQALRHCQPFEGGFAGDHAIDCRESVCLQVYTLSESPSRRDPYLVR